MGSNRLVHVLLAIGLLTGLLTHAAAASVPVITSRGDSYVSLSGIASYYSMSTAPSGDRIRMQNRWHTLEFEINSRRVWINSTLIWLNHPLRRIKSQWAVQQIDFDKVIEPALRPYAFLDKAGNDVVVLDPGHGALVAFMKNCSPSIWPSGCATGCRRAESGSNSPGRGTAPSA